MKQDERGAPRALLHCMQREIALHALIFARSPRRLPIARCAASVKRRSSLRHYEIVPLPHIRAHPLPDPPAPALAHRPP